jgi:hemoglobin-like flavoprotein
MKVIIIILTIIHITITIPIIYHIANTLQPASNHKKFNHNPKTKTFFNKMLTNTNKTKNRKKK